MCVCVRGKTRQAAFDHGVVLASTTDVFALELQSSSVAALRACTHER